MGEVGLFKNAKISTKIASQRKGEMAQSQEYNKSPETDPKEQHISDLHEKELNHLKNAQ